MQRSGFATPIVIAIGVLVIAVVAGVVGFSLKSSPKASPTPTPATQTFSTTPTPSPTDETANWEVAGFGTWSAKYPQQFQCGDTEGWVVCVTGDYSNDISIGAVSYNQEQLNFCIDTPGVANYDQCLQSFRAEFKPLEYERQRIVNGVTGVELFGTVFGGRKRKLFFVETSEKSGIIKVYQYDFSSEIDRVYEKILTTIKP